MLCICITLYGEKKNKTLGLRYEPRGSLVCVQKILATNPQPFGWADALEIIEECNSHKEVSALMDTNDKLIDLYIKCAQNGKQGAKVAMKMLKSIVADKHAKFYKHQIQELKDLGFDLGK